MISVAITMQAQGLHTTPLTWTEHLPRAVGWPDKEAIILPGRGSGDGPLSVRGRPSFVKGALRFLRNGLRPPLTGGASAPPPASNYRAGPSLPGPDAGHPLPSTGGHQANENLAFALRERVPEMSPNHRQQPTMATGSNQRT